MTDQEYDEVRSDSVVVAGGLENEKSFGLTFEQQGSDYALLRLQQCPARGLDVLWTYLAVRVATSGIRCRPELNTMPIADRVPTISATMICVQ
jgi:hypothetical protein